MTGQDGERKRRKHSIGEHSAVRSVGFVAPEAGCSIAGVVDLISSLCSQSQYQKVQPRAGIQVQARLPLPRHSASCGVCLRLAREGFLYTRALQFQGGKGKPVVLDISNEPYVR